MGLMELPRAEPGQLIVTPHPLLLDGQRNVIWEARAGESLYALLMRNVPDLDGQTWAVSIGGVPVQRHLWHHVRPKQGQIIEVRGGVGRMALMIVAMAVLTYFTMGAGAGWIAGAFNVAAGGMAAVAIGAGLFMAGSMLINKVLGPKPAKASNQQEDSVYSISSARNQLRPYEPLPLLFGRMRITPDLLSKPYSWYEGNDQYLGILLCAGVNVGRVEAFYNGDTDLSSFDGVQVYHAGYSQMPDQSIPLYSNADTIDGAELTKDKAWVERTTSSDTVRIQISLEYVLGGSGTSGKNYSVSETVEAQYRVAGGTTWQPLVSQGFRSDRFDVRRATLAKDVAPGQYDVRVRMLGYGNYSGKNTQKNDFQWTTLTSVQVDEADYTGLSCTGLRIKATGQLNGAPDELRAVGHADPIPVWDGASWSTLESSNPGAQILAYARGIVRGGRLLGGMVLADEQIDIASLKAFSLHCAANGYTYDYYVKNARSHEQVLSAIALAGFGQITWAGGRLGVVWAAQDQPLSGTVNMGVIKKGQFQVDYNLSNAADGIEYTYFDSTTWDTKTLRVPAPGVTTMLNPAQVTGEGVSSEKHAACMARWHLAQSLYQYKDIGYSTDIEHLSYQRLSLLAMQHDMTQWGFGGRLSAAMNDAGIVTLTLDEAVPAPANGSAYIGLRIPGERICRVLKVAPFAGESQEIVLAEPWPEDAALPGNVPENPAHDTLWIYDFKKTPGQRVRVVSIQPESDLKGASVRVVLEGPEFWNYVLTGHYVPSPNESQLQTRPVASNLRITEQQVVQGDTQFTELTATFDITGPVGNILVLASGQEQELREVAQTQTRTATWRIPQADVYSVVVRPFAPDGTAGVAVSATYATAGADVPPVLVDLFDVQEQSGGVRLYTWGWLEDTMRSADFAGVEIRHIAGNVSAPDWDAMTPIGDTGYHTAAFEAVVPVSGQWTFACRSRNSGGELSSEMLTVVRTLGKGLGEVIQTVRDTITQETIDRFNAGAKIAADAAADALAKASAARDAAEAYADGLFANVGDLIQADEWVGTKAYPKGDFVQYQGKLYRSRIDDNLDQSPITAPSAWEKLGDYASAGEAIAASLSMSTQNASDISAQSSRVDAVVAKLPADGGIAAGTAQVASEATASVGRDNAIGLRIDAVNVALGDKASVTAVNTLNGRVDVIDGRVTAQGDAIISVTSNTAAALNTRQNIMPDPTFAIQGEWASNYGGVWSIAPYDTAAAGPIQWWNNVPCDGRTVFCDSTYIRVDEGQTITASVESRVDAPGSKFYVELLYYDGAAAYISSYSKPNGIRNGPIFYALSGVFDLRKEWATTHTAPARTVYVRMRVVWALPNNGTTSAQLSISRPKIEIGNTATPYNDQMSAVYNAGATLALKTRTTALEAASSATLAAIAVLEKPRVNMLLNPTFDVGGTNWAGSNPNITSDPQTGGYAYHEAVVGGVAFQQDVDANGGTYYTLSADMYRFGNTGVFRAELQYLNASGGSVGERSAFTDPNSIAVWQRPNVTYLAPAGTVKARIRIIWENTPAPALVRRVKLEQGTAASPYSNERTESSSAKAVIDLSSRVTPLEVSAAATTAVLAQTGASGNLLPDSGYALTNLGNNDMWLAADSHGYLAGVNLAGAAWHPPGVNAIGLSAPGTMSNGTPTLMYMVGGSTGKYCARVIPGKTYIVSAYIAGHRIGAAQVAVMFRDATAAGDVGPNNLYSTGGLYDNVPGGGQGLNDWRRSYVKVVAPAGAAFLHVGGQWENIAGQANPYFWICQPMVEEATALQTQPSPYSESSVAQQTASAITTLSASINATTGKVNAVNGVYLDVNGYVSGTVSENDGVRSSFTLNADLLRVVSPRGGARTEYSDGNWRVYDAAGVLRAQWGVWS